MTVTGDGVLIAATIFVMIGRLESKLGSRICDKLDAIIRMLDKR